LRKDNIIFNQIDLGPSRPCGRDHVVRYYPFFLPRGGDAKSCVSTATHKKNGYRYHRLFLRTPFVELHACGTARRLFLDKGSKRRRR